MKQNSFRDNYTVIERQRCYMYMQQWSWGFPEKQQTILKQLSKFINQNEVIVINNGEIIQVRNQKYK